MSATLKKRRRTDMSPFTCTLDALWHQGMTNYRKDDTLACAKITEAVMLTGLDEHKIKTWIDNRKKKERTPTIQKEKEETTVLEGRRKPNSFQMFYKEFCKTVDHETIPFKEWSTIAAAEWKAKNEEEKNIYRGMADAIRPVELERMDDVQRKSALLHLKKKLTQICMEIERIGAECSVVVTDPVSGTWSCHGTLRGKEALRAAPDINSRLFQYHQGMSPGVAHKVERKRRTKGIEAHDNRQCRKGTVETNETPNVCLPGMEYTLHAGGGHAEPNVEHKTLNDSVREAQVRAKELQQKEPEVYVVKDILMKRPKSGRKGKKNEHPDDFEYFVLWENGEVTWEPYSNMNHLLEEDMWTIK